MSGPVRGRNDPDGYQKDTDKDEEMSRRSHYERLTHSPIQREV